MNRNFKNKSSKLRFIFVNFLVICLISLLTFFLLHSQKNTKSQNTVLSQGQKTSRKFYDRQELTDLWKNFPKSQPQSNMTLDSYIDSGKQYQSVFLKNLMESFGIRIDPTNKAALFALEFPINGPEFVANSNDQNSIFNLLEQRYNAVKSTPEPDLDIVIKTYNFNGFDFRDLEILAFFSDEIRSITFEMESKSKYPNVTSNKISFPDFSTLYKSTWLKELTKIQNIRFVNSIESSELSSNSISLSKPTDRGYLNLDLLGSILYPLSPAASSKFVLGLNQWSLRITGSQASAPKQTLFTKMGETEQTLNTPEFITLDNKLLVSGKTSFVARLSLGSKVYFTEENGNYSISDNQEVSSIFNFEDKTGDYYRISKLPANNIIYIEKSSSSGLANPDPEVGISNIIVAFKSKDDDTKWNAILVEPAVFKNVWYWDYKPSFFGDDIAHLVRTRITCSFVEGESGLATYLMDVTSSECRQLATDRRLKTTNLKRDLLVSDGGTAIVSSDAGLAYPIGFNKRENYASGFKSFDIIDTNNYTDYFGDRLKSVTTGKLNGKEISVIMENSSTEKYGYFLANGAAWLNQKISNENQWLTNPTKVRFYNATNGLYYESYKAIPQVERPLAMLTSVTYDSPVLSSKIPEELIEKFKTVQTTLNFFNNDYRNFVINFMFLTTYFSNNDGNYTQTGSWTPNQTNHISFGSNPFYYYKDGSTIKTNIPSAELYGSQNVDIASLNNNFNPKNYKIRIDGQFYRPELFSQLTKDQLYNSARVNDPSKPSNFFYANNLIQYDFSKAKIYFHVSDSIEGDYFAVYSSIEIALEYHPRLFTSGQITELTQVGDSITLYDYRKGISSLISYLQNKDYIDFSMPTYNVNTLSHPGTIKEFINSIFSSNENPFINVYLRKKITPNEILLRDPTTMSNQESLALFLQTIDNFAIKIDGQIVKLSIIGGRIYWNYSGEWTDIKYSYDYVKNSYFNRENFFESNGAAKDNANLIELFTSIEKLLEHKSLSSSRLWSDYKQLGFRSDPKDPLSFSNTPQKSSYILPKYSDLTKIRPNNPSVIVDFVTTGPVIKVVGDSVSSNRILIWKILNNFPKYMSVNNNTNNSIINYFTQGNFPIQSSVRWTDANAIRNISQLDFLTEIERPDDWELLIIKNNETSEVLLKDKIAPEIKEIATIFSKDFISSLVIGSASGNLPACEYTLIGWQIRWICGDKKSLEENKSELSNIKYIEKNGNVIRILNSLNQSSFWNLQINANAYVDSVLNNGLANTIPEFIISSEDQILWDSTLRISDPKSIDDELIIREFKAKPGKTDELGFVERTIKAINNKFEDGRESLFWSEPELVRTIWLVYNDGGKNYYYIRNDAFMTSISNSTSQGYSIINSEFKTNNNLSMVQEISVSTPAPQESALILRNNTLTGMIIIIAISVLLVAFLITLTTIKIIKRRKTVEVI